MDNTDGNEKVRSKLGGNFLARPGDDFVNIIIRRSNVVVHHPG
jgi:hypothetical protein